MAPCSITMTLPTSLRAPTREQVSLSPAWPLRSAVGYSQAWTGSRELSSLWLTLRRCLRTHPCHQLETLVPCTPNPYTEGSEAG